MFDVHFNVRVSVGPQVAGRTTWFSGVREQPASKILRVASRASWFIFPRCAMNSVYIPPSHLADSIFPLHTLHDSVQNDSVFPPPPPQRFGCTSTCTSTGCRGRTPVGTHHRGRPQASTSIHKAAKDCRPPKAIHPTPFTTHRSQRTPHSKRNPARRSKTQFTTHRSQCTLSSSLSMILSAMILSSLFHPDSSTASSRTASE